jgi:hypothetical protein
MTTPPSEPTADLDRLLTAFYQSELPKPWPRPRYPSLAHAHPSPAASSRDMPRHAGQANALSQGKFALALSVALLLGSCWYLSGLPVADWSPPAATNRESVNPFDLNANQRLLDQQLQLQRPGSQPAPNAPALPQVDLLNLHQPGDTGLPKNAPTR